MPTGKEEALRQLNKANMQIILGMGALLFASLNTTKAIRHLRGVRLNEVVYETSASPEDTKEALEEMVTAYSESVN